jgi:hypothetical protein
MPQQHIGTLIFLQFELDLQLTIDTFKDFSQKSNRHVIWDGASEFPTGGTCQTVLKRASPTGKHTPTNISLFESRLRTPVLSSVT